MILELKTVFDCLHFRFLIVLSSRKRLDTVPLLLRFGGRFFDGLALCKYFATLEISRRNFFCESPRIDSETSS